MAVFKSNFTNKSKVDRLLNLINSDFFLAISRDTEWSNADGDNITEENPPSPNATLSTIEDIKLYKKPFYQTLAVESQCGTIEFDSCGETLGSKKLTLINLETTSREALDLIAPSYVALRIEIEESDLSLANVESFRVAGLYKGITFTTNGAIRYLPSQVDNQGLLYWVSYFTPVFKNTIVNKSSIFEIIITA